MSSDDGLPREGVYGAFWLYPLHKDPDRTDQPYLRMSGRRRGTNSLNYIEPRNACILYPAFLTPSVVVGAAGIEFLLLLHETESEPLRALDVNRQLKFSAGLNMRGTKSYSPSNLFESLAFWLNEDGVPKPVIRVSDQLPFEKDQKLKTEFKFNGYVDERAFDFFTEAGYTKLYSVTINVLALKQAESASVKLPPEGLKWGAVAVPGSPNDRLVDRVISKLIQDDSKPPPGNGRLAFAVSKGDVEHGNCVAEAPLQAFHPIHYRRQLHYANFAHVSDIHINARANALAQTNARVIELDGGAAADQVSPQIGRMMNVPSRSFAAILNKIKSNAADILLVGGDLIDYQRNCWAKSGELQTPGAVWKRVAIGDGDAARYQSYVDFVSFYSLLLEFVASCGKPAFAITGNHDCYHDPYGLSPRIKSTRMNPGIPADHNLTIYEAFIAFGETATRLPKKLMYNFSAKRFAWFYGVLTPFKDYVVMLPKQALVGLCWGDEENIISAPPVGHGLGHLPDAPDSMSDDQSNLIEMGIKSGKKTILMTHFTAVSYIETVPMGTTEDKPVPFAPPPLPLHPDYFNYNDYNMGTFKKNRARFFTSQLQQLQCVISGHTHRRGLYLLTGTSSHIMSKSMGTRYFDFDEFSDGRKLLGQADSSTVVLVSDSAGPIPRYNHSGEFFGWGSSPPSGTLVTLGADGNIKAVERVAASGKPRLAVSLDYMDLEKKRPVFFLKTPEFDPRDEATGKLDGYTFCLSLNPHLGDIGVQFSSITMYGFTPGSGWQVTNFQGPASGVNGTSWKVAKKDMKDFNRRADQSDLNFVSVQLAVSDDSKLAVLKQYDVDSRWNISLKIRREPEMALDTSFQISDPEAYAFPPAPIPTGRQYYVISRWPTNRMGEWEDYFLADGPDGTSEMPDFNKLTNAFEKYR